jgi:hypothetical protein
VLVLVGVGVGVGDITLLLPIRTASMPISQAFVSVLLHIAAVPAS